MNRLIIICVMAFAAALTQAQEAPLAPGVFAVPGVKPTPYLRYVNPTATVAEVAGTWNQWTSSFPMTRANGQFVLDVRTLPLPKPGRYEFKFIANKSWEVGDNRSFFVNDEGMLERPPDVVLSARLEDRDEIKVYLKHPPRDPARVKVQLEPDVPIRNLKVQVSHEDSTLRGYLLVGGLLRFVMDEKTYGLNLPPTAKVAVAGNFNYWNGDGGRGGIWTLSDPDDDGVWELTVPFEGLSKAAEDPLFLFRFVLDGQTWLNTPTQATNGRRDPSGNLNLSVDPAAPGSSSLTIFTEQPLDLSEAYTAVLDNVAERRIRQTVSPGQIMEKLVSAKELGSILDRERGTTTYRLFAPRARAVHLNLFATPEYEVQKPTYRRLPPDERYALWKDEADGVWEVTLLGLDIGRYYAFNVDGPSGDGEGFNGLAYLGDPYAVAAAHAHQCTMVMDREATNQWFGGWTDQAWKMPAHEDILIYEAHVRDLTIHPSSKVPPQLRGTYEGVLASAGTGSGLDHIKALGFNAIEFMPINEFENGARDYNWGYNSVYFFAPEASYARQPLKGSQYYEFKRMVNELHNKGFAVLLDVVYNHVGGPNIYSLIDKKYFFRLTPDNKFINFSGCGNDVKTESPMMRRLIVDNVLYFMREHKVDGFRFDLAELIDMPTMMEIRDKAKALNPDVLLISEPWSLRAQNKEKLKGTGWSAWNNDFRYAAKDFARGRADRDWLKKTIMGSVDIWTENPLQAVNYLESHDDMALADELSLRPDRNGKYIQSYEVSMNKLAATVLFTSLGIPMINSGQEFLRSKYGIQNTYDKGDAVNALRWTDRETPLGAEALRYYQDLVALRQSDEGRAFRVKQRPPEGYYQWIMPQNGRCMGYIVNARRIHAGRSFVVLLNGSDQAQEFSLTLPEGRWRIIGDGTRIDRAGRPDRPTAPGGPVTLRVKEMSSLILMDGF